MTKPELQPTKLEYKFNDQEDASPVLANKSARERISHHDDLGHHRPCSLPDSSQDFTAYERANLETIALQRQRTALHVQQNRIVELLAVNQNRSKLPQPCVPVFDGDPMNYRTFIRAFESLIESRSVSSVDRMYYLEQYTSGDVKELVRSCHHLPPDEGYDEARRLLKKKFGDEFRIASSYETKALDWPNIKPEDGAALNRFSIFLASCKNALASSQYISKFDHPGNIQISLQVFKREMAVHS